MPEKLIVVTGATGTQGGSVARLYAKETGWKVRGVTRDPSKPSNAKLREAGVELVAADFDDPASLEKAFDGANVVFSVTDFWQSIKDPNVLQESQRSGRPLNVVACEREVQQGKNIVDAVAKQSKTLGRFVQSTLSNSERMTGGEVKWNLHFDGKGRYTDYLKNTYPELAAKTSYLYIGVYLNTWTMPLMRPQKQADGTFVQHLVRFAGTKPLPYLDADNDTGYFVKALIDAPSPTAVLGGSRFMTVSDFWRKWAEIKGVKLVDQVVDKLDYPGVPEWLQLELTDSKLFTQTYGWAGEDPEVRKPEDIEVEMDKLTDIETWIAQEKYEGFL